MKTLITAALFFLPLIFGPIWFEEFETGKVMALILLSCMMFFFIKWKEMLRDRIALSLFLMLVISSLSALCSIDTHMSIWGNPRLPNGVMVGSAYLIFYLAASQALKNPQSRMAAVRIAMLSAAIVAVYAILQAAGIDFQKWQNTQLERGYMRPMSTLGHPNFMAAYLAMIFPFAAWRAKVSRYAEKYLCYALAVLCVVAIFLSGSRGMWLALAGAIGTIIYFWMRDLNVRKIAVYTSIVAVVIGCFLATDNPISQTINDRMQNILSPGPARLEYPAAALRIWKRNPILGAGTDTYELAFRNQRTPEYWRIEPKGSPHRAHNEFLNILATQGLLGAIAVLIFTAALFSRIRHSRTDFKIPAAAAAVAFYIQELSCFHVVATVTLLLLCLAITKNKLLD